MYELLHIYGPFSIYSYGVAIAIGLLVFTFLIKKHPLYRQLKLDSQFTQILLIGIGAAIMGGRILYLLENREQMSSISDIVAFWQGGFSVLGSVLGVLFTLPVYLKQAGIPIIPLLDLFAIYAPLLLSISRLGCFFAGCCYGTQTTVFWAVHYTDPAVEAPLNICLHPTQLYSSASLFVIFILLYFFLQNILRTPGQLITSFLMLISAERFLIDFWRGDQVTTTFISMHQTIAITLFACSLILFVWLSLNPKKLYKSL